MANKYVSLILLILLLLPTASAKEDNVKMTTCRLASQILGNNQRVCVFIGANNTQYREYLPYDADLALDNINVHIDLTKNLLILKV